jgi:hypothetical protein
MNVVHLGDYSRGYATEADIDLVKLGLALRFSDALEKTLKEIEELNRNLPFYIPTLDFAACIQDNVADLQAKLTKAQEKLNEQ